MVNKRLYSILDINACLPFLMILKFDRLRDDFVARDEGACYIYASRPASPSSFAGYAYLFCILRHYRCSKRSHSLFPNGNLASNQFHKKLRNVMATANEFVGGDDFETTLFLFQTQSNGVSS